MKNLKFKFYAGKCFYNGINVAIYENKSGNYVLQVESVGKGKVRGYPRVELSKEEFDNLPEDVYNDMKRLQAALAVCGFYFE